MTDFKIISLFFLTVISMDAIGDALRQKGKQVPSHILEAVRIALWIALISSVQREWLEWNDLLIAMYATLRIAIFGVTYNIVAGNKWSYVGKSSLYGRVLTWFSNLPKIKEPGFLIWVIRVLSLIWFVSWFITDAGGRI